MYGHGEHSRIFSASSVGSGCGHEVIGYLNTGVYDSVRDQDRQAGVSPGIPPPPTSTRITATEKSRQHGRREVNTWDRCLSHSTVLKREIGLLVVNYGSPELYSNQRDGTFRNVSKEVGLDIVGHWSCAAAGDVNKDGYTDFVLGRADGPALLVISDGKERFKTSSLPAGSEAAKAIQFLDYDNDGLLDCVMIADKGLRVWRNVGTDWMNTSDRAVATELGGGSSALGWGRALAAGDIDSDGDADILFHSAAGVLRVGRNEGGNSNHSLRVNYWQGEVTAAASVRRLKFERASCCKNRNLSTSPPAVPADGLLVWEAAGGDAVRVIWPAGIVQVRDGIARPANAQRPKPVFHDA